MKKNSVQFNHSFTGKVWRYNGPAGWYFITLPITLSKKIRKLHSSSEEGWGRLKTSITIGSTSWKTAIWFDTKANSYLLPIKADIRKKEKLDVDSRVKVFLEFDLDKWLFNQD